MLWFLVVLLVVVPTVLLVLVALGTKRHVAGVARDVSGEVARVNAVVEQIAAAQPPRPPTCPTCGQRTPTDTPTDTPTVTSASPAASR